MWMESQSESLKSNILIRVLETNTIQVLFWDQIRGSDSKESLCYKKFLPLDIFLLTFNAVKTIMYVKNHNVC